MKILLLSDAIMNPNAGGINQTLYNLFLFSEPQNILCVSVAEETKTVAISEPFVDRYLTYSFNIIPFTHNRFSKYINPFITWANFSINARLRRFAKLRKQIEGFNPDIIVSCSNGAAGVLMHQKLLMGFKSKTIFPYFMDDWMYQLKLNWWGGEIHKSIKQILTDNTCWLMISKQLSTIIEERYDVRPKRLLEIHNPVDLSNAPSVLPLTKKSEYNLAYAGALWPMHFDSFKLIAEAVNQLKGSMAVNLILYTREQFWNWRKADLELLGVIYGGSIPYKNIHQKLAEADVQVLASSFLDEFRSHSKGSLQTKITDYLKSKRLIVSCGPDYSANHKFLKENECGICIESNDISLVTTQLKKVLDNIENYQPLISNGWQLLEREFTFPRVHQKLIDFISEPC